CQRRSVCGDTTNVDHRWRGSRPLAAASTTRSRRRNSGRFADRRSTLNWYRKTAFSTSSAAAAPPPATSRANRRTSRCTKKKTTPPPILRPPTEAQIRVSDPYTYEDLEVIRVEAGMPTSRFVRLVGVPER